MLVFKRSQILASVFAVVLASHTVGYGQVVNAPSQSQSSIQPIISQPILVDTSAPQQSFNPIMANQQVVQPIPTFAPQQTQPTATTAYSNEVSMAARMHDMELRLNQMETELATARKAVNANSSTSTTYTPTSAEILADPAKADAKPEDPLVMSAKWNNGLEFSSKDKNFRIHVGGRTQLDAVWLEGSPDVFNNPNGTISGDGGQDATDFRRARLRVDGTFYKYYEFAAEYDFVNSSSLSGNPNVTAITDLWWTVKEVPWVGNFRIGHMKEPLGLEHAESSRFLDFMERSFNFDAFTGPFNNGFSTGMMIYDWNECESATWSLGAFKNLSNVFAYGVGDGEYAATGRVTWLPIYDEASEGAYLLHLGLGGSYRDTDNDQLRLRARGSLRNGPGAVVPVYADTGLFDCDSQSLISPEVALVYGPWLFQAEYTGTWAMDVLGNTAPNVGVPQGSVYFQGYYVEALYFLTGEHREYERKEARFGRVKPHTNAYLIDQGCGSRLWCSGAWQVGARYSKLDLTNKAIDGGTIQDVTIGLNWFINPNLKVQWNYVYMDRDASGTLADGDSHGVGMRVAHDF